jgi:hypothetical protein
VKRSVALRYHSARVLSRMSSLELNRSYLHDNHFKVCDVLEDVFHEVRIDIGPWFVVQTSGFCSSYNTGHGTAR